MNEFYQRIYDIVSQIPQGSVLSYGQVSRLAGHPRGARVVGYAMRCAPEGLPCHRVVFSDGALCPGEIFGGEHEQRKILSSEGVLFLKDGKVDMKTSGIGI